ncbi:MAG TPA: Holliday junction resolvase RuvX [Actinomycetota bacterium]|nr:Holliday junction resolvase RuvX [Actinomycetota bacterium]
MPSSRESAGRVIALDVGEVRIGVALSDPDRKVALPAGTIVVRGAPQDLKAVAGLVREHAATEVVVGHPLSLSGERGPAAHRAEEFAVGLRAVLEVPVHLHDERLTTVEANRDLRSAGATGREARRAVDQAAASIILRGYLERSAGQSADRRGRGRSP